MWYVKYHFNIVIVLYYVLICCRWEDNSKRTNWTWKGAKWDSYGALLVTGGFSVGHSQPRWPIGAQRAVHTTQWELCGGRRLHVQIWLSTSVFKMVGNFDICSTILLIFHS